MEKLKSCPFCGGEAEITGYMKNGLEIKCTNCHFKKTGRVIRQSIEWLNGKLSEDWNRRAKCEETMTEKCGKCGGNIGACFFCDKTANGLPPVECELKAGTSYCYKECEFHVSCASCK